MRWHRMLPLLLLAVLVAVPAWADYLEVRRPATIKEQPDGDATVLQHVGDGTYFRLVTAEQTDGYYEVALAGIPPTGWIYRTLVRRYAGDPPPGTVPADQPEVVFPQPPAGPIPPEDAPVDVSVFRAAGCPPEGDAVYEKNKRLNRLKNRTLGPRPSQVQRITFDDLSYPAIDSTRWSSDYAIELDALVVDVKPGGNETCNCHASAAADKDAHIELAIEDGAEKSRRVVVEVTPAWRAFMNSKGVDWTTPHLKQTLIGHWIRVHGWMMFDAEHADESRNTAPNGTNVWRATAWEIHPVTSLEILPTPIP